MLRYKTASGEEVILQIITLDLGTPEVAVFQGDRLIAHFDICTVWDMLKNYLATAERGAGIERRAYEARNIHRLQYEYLEKKKGGEL